QQIVNSMSEIENSDMVNVGVGKKIKEIFLFIKPTEVFMYAIDGIAATAKILQQRGRRERSGMESLGEPSVFDRSAITPGTNFMNYLHVYLMELFKDSIFRSCKKVIYSSHRVVGEGEHKIMEYIR